MGRKYRFTKELTPRLRKALGLDEVDVGAAYERLHHEPLDSIYAADLSALERLRWKRSAFARRLEELPPFWSAYALAFTETVGAGILALPIALAGVGPLPGIAFLVIAGLLNVLTIGGMVEAITRNGSMRYGSAYFGRLASALLGRGGSSVITGALLLFNVVTFLTYLIAFAAPLASATNIDPTAWVALLFAINLFYLRRDMGATVASALLIGVINVLLILVICTIAFGYVETSNLEFARIPFFGENPAGVAAFGLAFGVVIMAYFGHTASGLVAKLVLEREPSGKALLRGSMAATATVIALYSLAVLAINGAVGADALRGYAGTSLELLAERVGPIITVLGVAYIVLAVGLASLYVSLGMANQVREWLPSRPGGAGLRAFAATERGGFLLSVIPAFVVFVAVEWLLITERASFSDPLAVIGTLAIPLLGGIFPMLLLAAARRRGERVPASWLRILPGPVAIGVVAAVFLAGLLVQGFIVWQEPAQRIATAVVAALIIVVITIAIRRGSFRPLATIELRRERLGKIHYAVTVDGHPQEVTVATKTNGDRSRASEGTIELDPRKTELVIDLEPSSAKELRVWAHGLTPEGDSEAIPAEIRLVAPDGEEQRAEALDGSSLLHLTGGSATVHILVG